jgi:hypothetical protein
MWGLTEYYHFQEVLTNFRVIANPLTDFNRFPLSISVFEHVSSGYKNEYQSCYALILIYNNLDVVYMGLQVLMV